MFFSVRHSIYRVLYSIISLCLLTSGALACADNETEQCAFGGCICVYDPIKAPPKIDPGTLGLPDIPVIISALSTGDVNKLYQSIGRSIMIGPTCFFCESVSEKLIGSSSTKDLEALVGRGFVTYAGNGVWAMISVDIGTSHVAPTVTKALFGTPSTSTAPAQTAPAPGQVQRVAKKFRVVEPAICAYLSVDGAGLAGWTKQPTLRDESAPAIQVPFDEADILTGDTLSIDASLCTTETLETSDVKAVSQLYVSFDQLNLKPGKQAMRYIIDGPVVFVPGETPEIAGKQMECFGINARIAFMKQQMASDAAKAQQGQAVMDGLIQERKTSGCDSKTLYLH